MDSPDRIVRRANVDDLPGLKLLWERARLQVLDLEKHLTEFQLIATPGLDLIGVVALQVDGKHGRIHSEAFTQPDQADEARPLLWQRIQNLARNHGLARLWTLESSPFWHQAGFVAADPASLARLPTAFGDRHRHWYTLALRDDSAQILSIEKEFELFQQSQRIQSEQVFAHARRVKVLAYLLTVIVAIIALAVFLLLLFKSQRTQSTRPPTRAPSPIVE